VHSKLENQNLEKRVDEIFEPIMIIVTVVLVFVLGIPALYTLSSIWQEIFKTADLIIWGFFYLEIVTKLIISRNRLRTLERNWLTVIILFAPVFRVFRLIRIVQILRVGRLLRLRTLESHLEKTIQEVVRAMERMLVVFLTLLLLFSFLVWQIEAKGSGNIQSFDDALWWSVTTVTTVGYGDVVPSTPEARVLASFLMIIGVMFLAFLTAKIASIFIHSKIEEAQNQAIKALEEKDKALEEKDKVLEEKDKALEKKENELENIINGKNDH